MAEYIEREALKNRFAKRLVWLKKDIHDEYSLGLYDGCEYDTKLIDEIPAADVAPVRHGRWEEADWVEPYCHGFGTIITPKAALRCSNCKNCFKKELLWKDNYCPNCGTDMRGSNDE